MFRPLSAALLVLALAPGVAVAAPSMSVTSDLGSVSPHTISECPQAKPGAELVACPAIFQFDRPELQSTSGTPITFRFTETPSPPQLQLTTGDGMTLGAPTWQQVDPLTYRLTFPADSRDSLLATVTMRSEDASYVRPLRMEAYLRSTPRKASVSLLGAARRAAGGIRVTLRASVAGEVQLRWQAAGRTGVRTVRLSAGRHQVKLAVPRRASRVRITGVLTPSTATRDLGSDAKSFGLR